MYFFNQFHKKVTKMTDSLHYLLGNIKIHRSYKKARNVYLFNKGFWVISSKDILSWMG
jgi:hypothetical protein